MTEEQGEIEKQAQEHCTSTCLQKPEQLTHSLYTIISTHPGTLCLLFTVMCTYCTAHSHIHTHMHMGTLPPVYTHAHTHTYTHCILSCTHMHMSTLYLLCILMHAHYITYSYRHKVILPFLCTLYTIHLLQSLGPHTPA